MACWDECLLRLKAFTPVCSVVSGCRACLRQSDAEAPVRLWERSHPPGARRESAEHLVQAAGDRPAESLRGTHRSKFMLTRAALTTLYHWDTPRNALPHSPKTVRRITAEGSI